jgi:hypothetical protein
VRLSGRLSWRKAAGEKNSRRTLTAVHPVVRHTSAGRWFVALFACVFHRVLGDLATVEIDVRVDKLCRRQAPTVELPPCQLAFPDVRGAGQWTNRDGPTAQVVPPSVIRFRDGASVVGNRCLPLPAGATQS